MFSGPLKMIWAFATEAKAQPTPAVAASASPRERKRLAAGTEGMRRAVIMEEGWGACAGAANSAILYAIKEQ